MRAGGRGQGHRSLPAVSVVFEFSLVKLHAQIGRLKVKRDHLAARVPEDLKRRAGSRSRGQGGLQAGGCHGAYLRHVVARVDSASFRIDAAHLACVVAVK